MERPPRRRPAQARPSVQDNNDRDVAATVMDMSDRLLDARAVGP